MSDTGGHDTLPIPAPGEVGAALAALSPQADLPTQLHELLILGFDKLPLPGSGDTLQRWQTLAVVAQHSLSLAKMYEGHTDAMAILAELESPVTPFKGEIWGVWAAEAANMRVIIHPSSGAAVKLEGTKCWCSGAQTVSHGLLTAWYADGRGPQLVRVAMHQPGISVSTAAWSAVGMAASSSVDVTFSQVDAHLVGNVSDYLCRPGFWHGGAGVAACWYGGARMLGLALHAALCELPTAQRSAFKLAALGKVDLALQSTAALLRDAAWWIDDRPTADASAVALRVRLAAEGCAGQVLDEAGRALGAAAFCRDARFARAAADLPVFVRQSHAERDFSALAEDVISRAQEPWLL